MIGGSLGGVALPITQRGRVPTVVACRAVLAAAHLALGLLLVAGVAKAVSPGGTAEAFVALGLDRVVGLRTAAARLRLARLLGVAEVMMSGVAATSATAGVFVAAAVLHVAFAVVVVRLGGLGPAGQAGACGCFGSSTAPVGRAHVVYDVAAAGSLAAVAASPRSLVDELAAQAWSGGPYLVLLAVGVTTLYGLLVELPSTRAASVRPAVSEFSVGVPVGPRPRSVVTRLPDPMRRT